MLDEYHDKHRIHTLSVYWEFLSVIRAGRNIKGVAYCDLYVHTCIDIPQCPWRDPNE